MEVVLRRARAWPDRRVWPVARLYALRGSLEADMTPRQKVAIDAALRERSRVQWGWFAAILQDAADAIAAAITPRKDG